MHRLLQRIIGEHIEIRTELSAEPSCVKADPGQIEQVIVNLGVNARDRVLATDRGTELAESRDQIHLSISDAVMLEMNGADVACCVYFSGFSE